MNHGGYAIYLSAVLMMSSDITSQRIVFKIILDHIQWIPICDQYSSPHHPSYFCHISGIIAITTHAWIQILLFISQAPNV